MGALIVNPFDPNAFSLQQMTEAINVIPNKWGRVGQLGIFTPEPITTTTAVLEEMNGVLNLVPSRPRGAPPSQNISGKRTVRAWPVPHFPLDDVVLPGDVQNVRAFGSGNTAETVAGVYARKLMEMRSKHAITLEHLRVRCLQGAVLDADASTIYNWFTEFGISQTSVDFVLGTATTKILAKCHAVKRAIEVALKGEVMTGVHVLCSTTFFDNFTTHAQVQAAYSGYQEAAVRLGGDNRRGFEFGGMIFEDYGSASATDTAGNVRVFITAGEAIAFPMGTLNTFKTIQAPANYMETANTPGLELYAKGVVRLKGDGVDLYSEMNVLPICKRPAVLIRLHTSN